MRKLEFVVLEDDEVVNGVVTKLMLPSAPAVAYASGTAGEAIPAAGVSGFSFSPGNQNVIGTEFLYIRRSQLMTLLTLIQGSASPAFPESMQSNYKGTDHIQRPPIQDQLDPGD